MSTREELTRQAEKCVRQGRLDEAIAQYQELAYLEPVDWGLVKQLADLLERASQREGAARQFARWADHLFAEGFHSKSAALYKKVLKLEPADEHALWQLGEVSLELKLRADARLAFQRVAELRQRRGDIAGAGAARDRLASFEIAPTGLGTAAPTPPAYLPPGPSGVPAAGEPAAEPAVVPAAPPPPAAAPPPPPPPPETRAARLTRLRSEAEMADGGSGLDADDAWHAVLDLDPDDVRVRLRLVQAACDRGAFETASALAASLDATEVPALVVLVELAFRSGQAGAVDRLIADRVHAGAPPDVVLAPVHRLAERHAGAARTALTSAVAAWTAAGQPGHAVAALEQAQGRGLLTTALYLQWVEICVDAGLPNLSRAQHALAGAYVSERRLAEARAVAEDLFVREAGAEPSRTLLLDILAREGVAHPLGVLEDLLTPPSDSNDDDALPEPSDAAAQPSEIEAPAAALPSWMSPLGATAPVVDPDPTVGPADVAATPAISAWDDDWSPEAMSTTVTMTPHLAATPAPSPEAQVTSPVPTRAAGAFNWADLLGRDVEFGSTHPVAAPAAAAAPIPVPTDPVEMSSDPMPDPAHPPPPALPSAADASPFADTMTAPRFGEVRPPVSDQDAPVQPPFSVPRAWLPDSSAASLADQPPQRAPEDDFFFSDDATPARWAVPAVRPAATRDEPTPAQPAAPTSDGGVGAGDLVELPADPPTPTAPETVATAEMPSHGPPQEGGLSGEPGLDFDESPQPARTATEPKWLIEEEIDLTQLLEELKQWDPVLPEPLVRPRPEGPPVPAGPGDAVDRPDNAPAGTGDDHPVHTAPDDVPASPGQPTASADPVPLVAASAAGSAALDDMFADLHRHTDDRAVAEQQLAAGRVFLAAGLVSEAARAFERASVEPRARFDAALALAELHRSRGQLLEAVSWYEQAAAAAVHDATVKRAVLYDLAESLEALGETDRALGVLLDLLSQVEDYRDARARLDRLLRVDAGG